ncbi:zinc-dependent metalloprotease [Aquiluna sp. KACHI24]|uniref:zinc-dependent metalloprotease n=1 Tax=Aquiluna sp. KACHI24 TaxID=2968831 RepID=UPI002207796F|nr:zinc-dependent metalloprotease [Aquiluna sp. KACHI24]BDQ00028.1 hydrolase [Aquiluna sp. KACHI24]
MNEQPDPNELERLIREMMQSGKIDPAMLEKVSGLISSPGLLQNLMSNFQTMFSGNSDAVNWDLALSQAASIARSSETSVDVAIAQEVPNAFEIAKLWLSEETGFENFQQPKILTRSMWAQDAMPLFKQLSEPIAISMAKALNESLSESMPEELKSALGSASNFLGNAGATLFAMQLGQAAGGLSKQVLTGSEIGIPLHDRPALVTQNLAELFKDLETPRNELLIYLAIRELAGAALFAANPYLREQIIAQIRQFASELKVDTSSIQQLAEQLESGQEMQTVIELGSALVARTEDQEIALERIETTLALIEGWVDSVSLAAARRLPSAEALQELYRRLRSASGVGQKTFAVLLGLELTPRLVREAAAALSLVAERFGTEVRDSLLAHPDQLPSIEEIRDPEKLIARLESDDDFDSQLRNLLGE